MSAIAKAFKRVPEVGIYHALVQDFGDQEIADAIERRLGATNACSLAAQLEPFRNLSSASQTLLAKSVVVKKPSRADAILEKANTARTAEFEKWLPVTRSTDHDDAEDFLGSEAGKSFLERQK